MHGGEKEEAEEEEEWISRAADRKTGIQREGAKTLRSEGTVKKSRGNAKERGAFTCPGKYTTSTAARETGGRSTRGMLFGSGRREVEGYRRSE